MQKKNKKIIKTITIIVIAIILLLLLIFAEDIIKLQSRNKLNIAESEENTSLSIEPNIPVISAGMIPVKRDGERWMITTQNDNNWYNYAEGKPAYIMINDGYYRSELERGITEDQLATKSVGATIGRPEDLGSIYIWIPRFEINEQGDIKYIKDIQDAEEGFTVPEIFAYRQEETMPDFLLTGVWVAIDTDENITTTIAEMNSEEGKYGFIKNTIATQITTPDITAMEKYIVVATIGRPQINDISNPNRTILKIINQNNQDPIKASISFNKDTRIIEIKVTYSRYGIEKILYENEMELSIIKNANNNGVSSTTEGIELEEGKRTVTIIDKKGNTKILNIEVMYPKTITFDANGGTVTPNSITIDGDTSISLPTPTKSGVTFGAWYEDSACTILAGGAGEKYTPKKNVTLYAKWIAIYAKLYNDGTLVFTATNRTISGKTVSYDFGNIARNTLGIPDSLYHGDYQNKVTSVDFADEISPITTKYWFYKCKNLTTINNMQNLDTSNVTNMGYMFYYCSGLTSLDLSPLDTSKVTDMTGIFGGCSGLTSLDLSPLDTSKVTDMSDMFCYCSGLTSLDLSPLDTSKVTDMTGMFCGCSGLTSLDLSPLDTSNVTSMNAMLRGCSGLTSLDLSPLDTSNVTIMIQMFYGCRGLTSLDLSPLDTSNVTNMDNMFGSCSSLTSLDLSPLDTSNVTNMRNMFSSCIGLMSLDLSPLDTSNVTDMTRIFSGCRGLTSLDLSPLDTSKVTDMSDMFDYCSGLTSLDLSPLDTSNVTNMGYMFNGCSGLTSLDLSSFDTSKVTNMKCMFNGCYRLKTIYVNKSTTMWSDSIRNNSTSNTSMYYYMFNGCGTNSVTRK